jgi:methionyl-tRNA synthetase
MTSKPTISFADWEKLDLRVGKILKVEDHPKADKLYVLTVDFGELGHRTIVAGLKKAYTKEQLHHKQGIFIANLAPVVLRGIDSNGMTLAASNEDHSFVTILTTQENIAPGSRVG